MEYDFSDVDDIESFVSVPEGTYVCRIDEVREGRAKDGSERWRFRLEVCRGEYAGRTAAWDSLTWSERGVLRVKAVLGALGVDVSGHVHLDAQDLVGLEASVQVVAREWEDAISGRRQVRMEVPYAGYAPVDEGQDSSSEPNPRARNGSKTASDARVFGG